MLYSTVQSRQTVHASAECEQIQSVKWRELISSDTVFGCAIWRLQKPPCTHTMWFTSWVLRCILQTHYITLNSKVQPSIRR